jgi:hypothetical protein
MKNFQLDGVTGPKKRRQKENGQTNVKRTNAGSFHKCFYLEQKGTWFTAHIRPYNWGVYLDVVDSMTHPSAGVKVRENSR